MISILTAIVWTFLLTMYTIFPHFLTMTQSNYVISDTPEVLNREHNVLLKEGQISTILYVLEGYIQGSDDYHFDDNFKNDVDNIFERLETVIDTYYEANNNPLNVTYPDVDYRELTPFEEEIEIQKYIQDNDDQPAVTNTNYRQLRDELLTLSEEQLDKPVQILHVLNEYYHTPISGVFYSTEEDDYNTILDAGHPYLQI